jgi:hypothetical protein
MNKRRLPFYLIAATLLVVGSWQTAHAAADENKSGPIGSYLWSFLGVGPGLHVPGLATLTADGTLTAATGSDLGGPSSVFLVKNSPTHGVWKRVGARGVHANAFFLNFDPVTGVVVGITRVRIVADFDAGFNHGTGVFYDAVWTCSSPFTCPDPLTSSPTIPEPPVGRPFNLDRVTVE